MVNFKHICQENSNVHSAGYVIAKSKCQRIKLSLVVLVVPISTAPAVEPAIIDRKALGWTRQ